MGFARFAKPLRDVGRGQAEDAFNISVEMAKHAAPVTKHINDDALPPCGSQTRALCYPPVRLEYSAAELLEYRENAPEIAAARSRLSFRRSGK